MLLLYHDGELMGAHSSREETLAKLGKHVWGPQVWNDTRKWVGTCNVCKLTKPQRELNVEQRTQLFDRPFRTLFMDSLGPIKPASDKNEYTFHVTCPCFLDLCTFP